MLQQMMAATGPTNSMTITSASPKPWKASNEGMTA